MRNSSATIAAIALRDGNRCYLCNQTEDDDDPFEIEHVKPRVAFRGSTSDPDDLANLRLAHRSCNRTKGTNNVVIKQ